MNISVKISEQVVQDTYVCSVCGKTKSDSESRYAFLSRDSKDKICFECNTLKKLEKKRLELLKNIDKEMDMFDRIGIEIKEIRTKL